MVTECSSFQLETTTEFRPVVSAILNLTPDHLNRHKTMKAYGDAKARVAVNQTPDEFLVVNYDDKAVMELAKQSHATIVPFSRLEVLDAGAYLDGTEIVIKDFDGKVYRICDRSDLRIIGNHNVENVLAAAAVAFYAGIDTETISRAVLAFPGVEHRIEFCGTKDGVDYYNDSKGTNVDAAVIALRALENNIILIAGGDGKSQDFTDLAAHLEGVVTALVLLGRDAPIIEEAARRAGFTEIYNCKTMEECVRKASDIARSGDKVLLSPACASWDMYPNYEVRGRHFKECVKDITG
jgi:UDP-N-acetylmuramoylalanine--D-glutamate ligase